MTELTVLKREHEAAEKCNICFKVFSCEKRKVRDHFHYIGLYQDAARNNCNLKYWVPDHILIVFNNLSGYNAHLFKKELVKKFNRNNIGAIAENKEKYISFNVNTNVKLARVTNKDGNEERKTYSAEVYRQFETYGIKRR